MLPTGTQIGIDVTQFNIWGINTIQRHLANYINNTTQATSAGYFHVVLTVFAVESMTDPGNVEGMYENWLTKDYSQAVPGYDTPDYKNRITKVFNEYKNAVVSMIQNHTHISPDKAYTADFKSTNFLIVKEVSVDDVTSSITEIF